MNDDDNQIDRWIDSLLRSSLARQIEAPPPTALQSVANSLALRRRRHRIAFSIAAAAAMLLVAVNWVVFIRRAPAHGQASAEAEAESAATMQANIAPAVFIAGDDSIAVPVASEYPDIAIVRVYAVYRPKVEQTSASPPESATNTLIEHKPINGG